jgi:hypothetical protein
LKVGLIVAGVASALAAAIVAYDGIWPLSVAVGLPAAVLLLALANGWSRVQLAAQVCLILELVVLGGIWPSLATLAALIALPSPVLGIVYLVKRRSTRPGAIYILVSTLLASSSLLLQAIVLAIRQQ